MPLTDDPQTLETATKLVNALRGAFNTPDAYRPGNLLNTSLLKPYTTNNPFQPTPKATS